MSVCSSKCVGNKNKISAETTCWKCDGCEVCGDCVCSIERRKPKPPRGKEYDVKEER